jgi:hypothetical protein
MTDTNPMEDWRVLCELASKEKDPERLVELIVKINRALEERHQTLLLRRREWVFEQHRSSTFAGR